MHFPQMDDKHPQPAAFTAADFLRGRGKRQTLPATILFSYQRPVLRHAVKRYRGKKMDGFFGKFYVLQKTVVPAVSAVGIAGNFGIGAPVTAVLLENFAASGSEQFIIVGLAGGLQPDLTPGDVIVATQALRDEGTSHHYLPPNRYVTPQAALTRRIQTALQEKNIPFRNGPTWTTDAPYRETWAEIDAYQQEGIVTVEMEAAALFAVARYLNKAAAAVFVIGDVFQNGRWQDLANPKPVIKALQTTLDALLQSDVIIHNS